MTSVTGGRKVLLISEFGGAHQQYTYATSFAKYATRLGYEVTCFDCKRVLLPLRSGSVHQLDFISRKINDWLMNRALKKRFDELNPDVVLLIKAENVFYKTLRWMKLRRSFRLINVYPDSPFSVWNGNSSVEVLRSLPLYDRFAIWSQVLMPALTSAGCREVVYFPFAYDHEIFFQGAEITDEQRTRYATDLLFVGTWDPERERILTELVCRLPSVDLAIWGGMWREKLSPQSLLFDHVRGGSLSAQQMVKAFCAAKIVLNLLRQQNHTSHNMRTFEVPACGAFLLAERSFEQAELLFREGYSIACFTGIDELVSKVQYFLTDDEARRVVAAMGHYCAQFFTLDRYVRQLLADEPYVHEARTLLVKHQESMMSNLYLQKRVSPLLKNL